ncbi:phage tail spike protein [Mammaliicoccus sciuri]|uniref:phage tail spike protein n=1 Tax=Mammaliicoccus sciuri TaxID=1296 RepID=UPI001E3E6A55|nr:phage tail spike protein [Mammaliicoccus sciuri]MCD8797380.1 hypothetical protein [Mammaliicoccus sciuri]
MIHVLNFEGQIIDFISQSDSAIIRAEHNRDINDRTETFDFTILSDRTEHLQKKNRIIIQDSNKQYREFIIEHISQDIDGYTEIETTASYFEDLAKAKPYGPSTLSKMTTRQALSDVLKDTGWEVSDQTEYGGIRTTSWTSYQTRYEVLLQLCTTYSMMADYYIELGNNTVEGRFVVLRERNPMFNGKEITYGKDLIGLKRTVDFSEVKTALLCVGPEKDDGSRIELVVTDEEAQENFGLPGRYSWGIYEPESDDQNMTEARLRTLGTTELNKRKSELISYEVTSTDISKVFKHEVTHLGDMVRIKNRDFTPPLYVEAEVISEQYDMIAEESTYGFGQYKEYRESELRNEFDKKLSDIRQKMHDNISNVNTIIQDTISGELEYYEKKIIKSDTPPENPVNDTLWYDTSNPDVAVLWRYWNGEWREHSVNDVEKIGGITREKALYSELSNTFINLSIQHSKLLNDVYEIINNEYFVDTDLKNEVNTKLDDTISVFNNIKTNLDSMTPETATIGKLIDTQLLFLTYRERMQALYNTLENAKIIIEERFKLLQSQYTEEKFNEAMQKVADKFGFELTEEGFLIGEGSLISGAIQALREDTNEQFKSVVKKTDYELDQNNIIGRMNTADSERKQLENEIADRVTKSEYIKMKIGTENLLLNSKVRSDLVGAAKYKRIEYLLTKPLNVGSTYTLIFDIEVLSGDNNNTTAFMGYEPEDTYTTLPIDNANHNKISFVANSPSTKFLIYSGDRNTDYNANTTIKVTNAMLVEGDKIGDYQPATKETDEMLKNMETSIKQNGEDINARATKEEFNASKKTLSKVIADLIINTTDGLTLSYDENGAIQTHTVGPDGIMMKGDRINIQANKAFNVLVQDTNKKVGKDEIINRINLSPEALDINVNNVGIRGGDTINYISIRNNEMLSYGIFERSWAGEKDTAKLELGIKDGRILIRNQNTGYRLYLTERGLSTMMDGYSEDTSGTLEFHSQRFNETSRGITMHSTYGAVAMLSEQSRAYIRSNLTANIESFSYGVYIRPYVSTRQGVNEFNFYVKDADSESGTDGAILFGEISDDAGLAGSGIRFKKSGVRGYDNMESVVYATDNQGNIGTGSFYADKLYGDWKAKTSNLYAMVDGEFRVTDFNGATGSSINYKPIRIGDINSYGSYANHSGSNVYFGVGLNELRVTNNNHYNGGNIGYKPVRAADFLKASSVKYKEHIKVWEYDALNVISNKLKLYSYKYKEDERGLIQHGPVIGDGYDTPSEFIFGDGINTNEMLSWALRAIQQLNEKIEILEEK